LTLVELPFLSEAETWSGQIRRRRKTANWILVTEEATTIQERGQAHNGMPILDNYSGFQANAATLEK